jgi:hypothetical protein
MKVVGTVWMLKYEHKHGDDITHYDEEAAALASAKGIIDDNIGDEEDGQKKNVVKAALANGDIYAACAAWTELTGSNEFLGINEHTIWSQRTAIDDMKEAVNDDDGKR